MRSVSLAMILCAGVAVTGCASIDQSLFGTSGPVMAGAEPSTVPAPEAPDDSEEGAPAAAGAAGATSEGAAAPPETPMTTGAMAGTLASTEGDVPASVAAPTATVAPVATGRTIDAGSAPSASLVTIAPGPDTGTVPGRTIAGLRANLQDVASRLAGAAQQLGNLRRSNAQQLTTYYQAQAQVSARLQIGTTRANPDLVAQWNAAQAALDQLTANINAMNTLATQINGEVTRTRGYLSQIRATLDAPGAVDEDHRQLAVLEDEANQAIVVQDRLVRDTTADLRRQTAALGSERGKLAQLANAIKAGDLYGSGSTGSAAAATAALPVASPGPGVGGAPIVTIRFARANTNYQKTLYDALSQALQTQPSASFNVVGVSPTRGSASAVQLAQNDARRRAQDVMHTMTEMGVPATRLALSSATDPAAKSSEVRVFIR